MGMLEILRSPILKEIGDEISARITPTGRKVGKIRTNGGKEKYAITQYKNGTIVETRSRKK